MGEGLTRLFQPAFSPVEKAWPVGHGRVAFGVLAEGERAGGERRERRRHFCRAESLLAEQLVDGTGSHSRKE